VKIDVEGAEFFVLKGMLGTLNKAKDIKILIEFGDNTSSGFGMEVEKLALWLLEHGMQLSLINPSGNLKTLNKDDLIGRKWPVTKMVVASRT